MNGKQILRSGAATLVLGLTFSGLAQDSNRTQTSNSSADRFGEDSVAQRYESSSGLRNANKASKLVHMKVHNVQNETLGRVEDVVFDFESGRVAYVVLSTDGSLGIGEKKVAIPLAAFTPALNEDKLILNADRQRLAGAPALDRNHWPSAEAPAWGAESYWMGRGDERLRYEIGRDRYEDHSYYPPRPNREYDERYGYSGEGYPRYDTSEPDRYGRSDRSGFYNGYGYGPDRDRANRVYDRYARERDRFEREQEMRGRLDRDYNNVPQYRDGDRDRSRGTASTARRVFNGEIVAIDPETRTMTVRSRDGGTMHFVFGDRPVLSLKNTRNPSIVDLKVGHSVNVGFHDGADGRHIAHNVIRTTAEEVK